MRVFSQFFLQGCAQVFLGQGGRVSLFADIVRNGFIEQVAAVAVLGFGNLIQFGNLLGWDPEAYGAQITHNAREYAVLQADANAVARFFFLPISLNSELGTRCITRMG
jgi:DNA-binding transcriptional regulator/RsmH inhibitor MraZ